MKKFSLLWWIEVVGAIVFAILGVMMYVGGANNGDIMVLGLFEALIIADIVYSLFKSDSTEKI